MEEAGAQVGGDIEVVKREGVGEVGEDCDQERRSLGLSSDR